MKAEQERLAKAQKRNFEIASGSVGGSDDERDTKEEAWVASVFASTSAAGAESAEEQRRRKLQRKAVPAEAAAPATAAKAVAPEALMGVEEDDDDDEEEGGMPLAPPTVEAILKGTKRGAAAAAPAAPPSKKGKSTHETAQPTAPPPKPAPLAAAKPAAPAPAPASKGGFDIDPEVKRELSALDNDLLQAFGRGDIALVRSAWLKAQLARQPDYRIVRRQDLKPVGGISPHLEPEEAKRLLLKGERAIGAFSFGWPTSGNPDPTGHRIEALWRALQERSDIEAFFWDFPSLYQNSDQSPRTEEQERAFKRGLGVMGHIYASAIGTTVLQLKELPLRPPEYDGKLCLFDLAPGVDGAAIKATLVPYGDIVSCTLGRFPPATVCFTTHAAAQAAKRAAAQLAHISGGVDTLFNERSYDGRHGEAGLDDDEGRGWCVFESAVSGELILRLSVVPRVKAELDKLPPKMLQLRSGCPLGTVDLSAGRLETRVDEVVARIERATFTGKGDKAIVVGLYMKYVDRIAGALQRVLPKMLASDSATVEPSELPPPVDAPAAAALRLAEGQPLLLLSWQGSGAGGGPRFGVVDATGGGVAAAVTGGDDAELAYDRCSQAVLPWRPPAAGWDAAFVGDARALRDLVEPARHLADDAGRMKSVSAVRAVGERSREIADNAARCQTIAHAAREAGGAVQSCVDAAAKLFSNGDPTQLQAALGNATLTLHPWNHAPRELPHAAYEAMRAWWARSLRANHGHITDALTGKRLDALQQCIAISVDAGVGGAAQFVFFGNATPASAGGGSFSGSFSFGRMPFEAVLERQAALMSGACRLSLREVDCSAQAIEVMETATLQRLALLFAPELKVASATLGDGGRSVRLEMSDGRALLGAVSPMVELVVQQDGTSSDGCFIGAALPSKDAMSSYLGEDAGSWGYTADGRIGHKNSYVQDGLPAYKAGDRIRMTLAGGVLAWHINGQRA
ncbi:hypothetical protein Ctob_014035, partial [Chrysochromulina tobinii]